MQIRSTARKCALSTIEIQKSDFMSWAIMGDWDNPYKTLAEAELEYQNDHKSRSVYVKFPLAVAINSQTEYSIVSPIFDSEFSHYKDYYIVANKRIDALQKIIGSELSIKATFEDYEICKKLNISTFCPVDDIGRFTAEVGNPSFEGKDVLKEGTDVIINYLKESKLLVKEHEIVHKYPYDWRTKKPIILRATPQWFINVEAFKQKAFSSLADIRILPDNESSIVHIIEIVKQFGSDAWWEIDEKELVAPEYRDNGVKYRRGMDTMDVWFDSGVSWSYISEKFKRQ
ncbi:15762_t:CDS:2, partial [Racocetra fulgida]